MKNYINGILYGIKISIKILGRTQDIKKSIPILCNIQYNLKFKKFKDNIGIWQYIESEIKKICS